MVAVQPQTIAQSLSERMAGYLYKKSVPPLVLRGFKKDAHSLKEISPELYFSFLGQIAALEYNKEGVIQYYKNAIRYSQSSILFYNYAVSLTRVGMNEMALNVIKQGFNLIDFKDINVCIAYHNAFSSFLSLSYVSKITPVLEKYKLQISPSITTVVHFFSEKKVSEAIAEELMVNVRDIIASYGLVLNSVVKYLEIENSLNVFFVLEDFEDMECVFNCNYAISEAKLTLEEKYNIDLSDILISCEVK